MKNQIIKKENFQKITNVISGISEISSMNKKEGIKSVSKILLKGIKTNFIKSFKEEWDNLVEKGKISNEYLDSDQKISCFQELFEALDNDKYDKDRFDILKKILLVTSTGKFSKENDPLPLEYMKIARNLEPGEIIVLFTTYKMFKQSNITISRNDYFIKMTLGSGLVHSALIEKYINILETKKLLNTDCSAGYKQLNEFMTSFGFSFCQYIENYKLLNN